MTGVVDARRKLLWGVAALSLGLMATLGAPGAPAAGHKYAHGYDVSWPQCSGSSAHNMPPGRARFAILGLTHGLGHTVNPCLGAQVRWARAHRVPVGGYFVISYPSSGQLSAARYGALGTCRPHHSLGCRLRNDGAAQARSAVGTMHVREPSSPMVWIDLESIPVHPWSHHRARNRAVVKGAVRQLRHMHERFGIYTTSYMWPSIVGHYHLGAPEWLPVGHGSVRQAKRVCAERVTGGPTWVVQYVRSLDNNLTCPVLRGVRAHHSALWPYRHTTLQLGSRGPAVRALQRKIGQLPNGSYGPLTTVAVSHWQMSHELPVTGRVTSVEWRVMGAFRTVKGHRSLLGKVARLP